MRLDALSSNLSDMGMVDFTSKGGRDSVGVNSYTGIDYNTTVWINETNTFEKIAEYIQITYYNSDGGAQKILVKIPV